MRERDSIRNIKGVGQKAESLYAKLGIYTIGDLLTHYPRQYDVYKPVQPVSEAVDGNVIVLDVSLATKPKISYVRNLKIVSCTMRDSSGSIPVSWFNMPYLLRSLKMGTHYLLRGKVISKRGRLMLQQPKMLQYEEYRSMLYRLQPLYPLTAGLTNNAIKKAVDQALSQAELDAEFLPLDMRKKYNLVLHKKALQDIHFPSKEADFFAARNRLVFEEFFLFTLAMHQMKQNRHQKPSDYILHPGDKVFALLENLPYELTEGQKQAVDEIAADVSSGFVMNRLIQGDVGSGKTIVAQIALLIAVEQGHQGAIMVPTEVLAEQHYETFCEMFDPLQVRVGLLTGSMTAAAKRDMQAQIAAGEIDIVVGTQALIQDKVEYKDLAMIVTDEQHRFGVRQRESFYAKGHTPHMLVMSATPIPRTLAIILYGELDISVIKGLPKGRLPIQNCVVDTGYRPQSYRFIEKEVEKGHQAYVICPMVEENENMEAENVTDYAQTLREEMSTKIRIKVLHGKMKPAQKNEIMERFVSGAIDVLVSTTVIEVGINVPNATVMMVENAERFGLAQLHQLRGRVGRGSAQSYCIFMMGKPSKETKQRLQVLEQSNDGFLVAEEDLKLRGPGDLFGIRQSGDLNFKLADIYQDAAILKQANEAAAGFERTDIIEMCKKYRGLREKIQTYTDEIFL